MCAGSSQLINIVRLLVAYERDTTCDITNTSETYITIVNNQLVNKSQSLDNFLLWSACTIYLLDVSYLSS